MVMNSDATGHFAAKFYDGKNKVKLCY